MSGEVWTGFPRAEASLRCSGETHRLRWQAGRLRLLDHVDPEGERALAALGGQACACVEVLDTWARHARDPRVLVLGARGSGDKVFGPDDDPDLAARKQMLAQRAARIRRPRPDPREDAERDEHERLLRLLSLGGGLDRRLIAEVARSLSNEPATPTSEAALYGRVLKSLRVWLGRAIELDLETISDAGSPTLTCDSDDRVRARLPFGWIVDVWGRELEVIWGRFCLNASSEDGLRWELLTVGPELGEPAVMRVELPR